jgi:phosphocarrier protein HPr
MLETRFVYPYSDGMHLRRAAVFVSLVHRHKCKVTVTTADGKSRDGSSLMDMMRQPIAYGDEGVISAEGDDAEDLLDEIHEAVHHGLPVPLQHESRLPASMPLPVFSLKSEGGLKISLVIFPQETVAQHQQPWLEKAGRLMRECYAREIKPAEVEKYFSRSLQVSALQPDGELAGLADCGTSPFGRNRILMHLLEPLVLSDRPGHKQQDLAVSLIRALAEVMAAAYRLEKDSRILCGFLTQDAEMLRLARFYLRDVRQSLDAGEGSEEWKEVLAGRKLCGLDVPDEAGIVRDHFEAGTCPRERRLPGLGEKDAVFVMGDVPAWTWAPPAAVGREFLKAALNEQMRYCRSVYGQEG